MNPFGGNPESLLARLGLIVGLAILAVAMIASMATGGGSAGGSLGAPGDALASKPTYGSPKLPGLEKHKGQILFSQGEVDSKKDKDKNDKDKNDTEVKLYTKGGIYPRSVFWNPVTGTTGKDLDMEKQTAKSTALYGYLTNATDDYVYITGFRVKPTDQEKPADNLTFTLQKSCSPLGSKLDDGTTCNGAQTTPAFYLNPQSHSILRYGEIHYLIGNIADGQFVDPTKNYTLELTGFRVKPEDMPTAPAEDGSENPKPLPLQVPTTGREDALTPLPGYEPVTALTIADIPVGLISAE